MPDETTTTEAPQDTPSAEEVQRPTVGRIVHLHVPGGHRPAAAIVTHVYSPGGLLVELYAFPCSWDGSPMYYTSIPHRSDALEGQTVWDWPPRA